MTTKTICTSGVPTPEPPPPSHPRDSLPKWKWTLIVVGNAIGSMINGFGVSQVANVQIPVYKAFGHMELLPWVSLAYSLVNMAIIPLARRLVAVCELKSLSLAGFVFLWAGSALCGAAPNFAAIIVGRAFTAVGSGGLYQIFLTFQIIFSYPHELAMAQAIMGVFFAVGLVTGPLIGGAFAENPEATWRWAFYIILPMDFILSVLVFFFFPSFKVPTTKPFLTNLKEIDWVGCILHIGTFLLLGLGCTFAGPTWGWSSPSSIVVWVMLVVCFVAYVFQQAYSIFTTPERRIFPVPMLRNRAVVLTCVCTACTSIGYAVTLYYTPIYFAFTRNYNALDTALHLLPYIGVFIATVFLSGALLPQVRYYKPFFVAGASAMLAGAAPLQTVVTPSTPPAVIMGLEALIAAGLGLQWQLAVSVSSGLLRARPADNLDAAALFNMAQLGGAALALAVAGAVYQNVGFRLVRDAVRPLGLGFGAAEVRELLAGVASPVLSSGSEGEDGRLGSLVVGAVTRTVLWCFVVTLVAGAVCFVAACGLRMEALPFEGRRGKGGRKDVDVEGEKKRDSSFRQSDGGSSV